MSGLKKTKIIVLKTLKYSEADLIVHGLTPEGAKLSLLARSALKSKRRFAGGVLEPTHYIEIQYRESSRSNGLSSLEEASLINSFDRLRTDYDRLNLALYVVEVASHSSQEGEVHSQSLFNLVGNSLRALQEVTHLNIFRTQFLIKFLHQQGVLVVEPWMKPFLSLSMAEGEKIQWKQAASMSDWLDIEVRQYLSQNTSV